MSYHDVVRKAFDKASKRTFTIHRLGKDKVQATVTWWDDPNLLAVGVEVKTDEDGTVRITIPIFAGITHVTEAEAIKVFRVKTDRKGQFEAREERK
ncbi:hypothetical protein CMI37_07225 [Candidatus Pacearchaeota archaeon]|nr:hypothetical protein [Candidatus Pacearchaeota archaeon]|tara:strand:+ start:1147 stop:1434 length:288 start_codon:yes stop_codon:yes gene_type:complete